MIYIDDSFSFIQIKWKMYIDVNYDQHSLGNWETQIKSPWLWLDGELEYKSEWLSKVEHILSTFGSS